tara:strand:+ start:14594 stop:14968 length:375 start_codon:yes stop_codon:yes gene_type:complete
MARETVTRADLDGAASELNGLLHTSVGHVRVEHLHSEAEKLTYGLHFVVVLDLERGDPVTHLSEPGTTGDALAFLKAMTLGAGLTREMVRRLELGGLRWSPDPKKNSAFNTFMEVLELPESEVK